MGIFLLAIIVDGLICYGGLYILCRLVELLLLKDKKIGILPGCMISLIFGTILASILFSPINDYLWESTVAKGSSVSYDEYESMWPIPKEASNITYDSNYSGLGAIFSIEEKDLFAWIKGHGLEPEAISSGFEGELHYLEKKFTIENGFKVEKMIHPRGTGYWIYYDSDLGICYYCYASY